MSLYANNVVPALLINTELAGVNCMFPRGQ